MNRLPGTSIFGMLSSWMQPSPSPKPPEPSPNLCSGRTFTRRRRRSLDDGKPVARIVPLDGHWKSGKELAALLREGPRLGPEEAAAFEEDLRAAREALTPPVVKAWD